MMVAKNELTELAAALGEALSAAPEVQAYLKAAAEAQADPQASQSKARLDEMYNDLNQRQAAGEVLSGGEIDMYYDLEREVEEHPALIKQTQALGRVKDLFTETHSLLTHELGFSLLDTIQ
jgi:cell fate (sporulation/competence/biofilm development) regulator YlbF (YheA/YmcA/DUF963 family)